MKIPTNVKTLIDNFSRYIDQTANMDDIIDEAEAVKLITVVERSTNRFYWLTGFDLSISDEPIALRLRSINPVYESSDGFAGSSVEYAHRIVHDDCFDEEFMLYDAWQHGLLNLTIAEMNKEIFKFLHPYFITAKQDWYFELSRKGTRMSLKFWGYGAYKYQNLVISIDKINKASITLCGDGHNESIKVFDYNDTAVTMDPVPYGALTEEDMTKLCDKVEEIMRRNNYEG